MENPNFETCSSRENREEFLYEPVLQNPLTLRKNPYFENFLGSPKNRKKPRKNPNFGSANFSKICLKYVLLDTLLCTYNFRIYPDIPVRKT